MGPIALRLRCLLHLYDTVNFLLRSYCVALPHNNEDSIDVEYIRIVGRLYGLVMSS